MRHFARAALALVLLTPGVAAGQAPDKAVPPPNTRAEGMPPLPKAIVDGVSRYGQFPTDKELIAAARECLSAHLTPWGTSHGRWLVAPGADL